MQSVPQRKHNASPFTKITVFILFREMIAVYYENYLEHTCILWGNTELFIIKVSGICSYHWAFNDYARLRLLRVFRCILLTFQPLLPDQVRTEPGFIP
jgi:hypothetical protein